MQHLGDVRRLDVKLRETLNEVFINDVQDREKIMSNNQLKLPPTSRDGAGARGRGEAVTASHIHLR